MAKVSISEAIRITGISRSHFYNKYINHGIISIINENNKKSIDVSELIRVFGDIRLEYEHKNTDFSTSIKNTNNTNVDSSSRLIELLEQQINEFRIREKESKERESWLQKQIDELRLQHNNLLENKNRSRKKIFGLF